MRLFTFSVLSLCLWSLPVRAQTEAAPTPTPAVAQSDAEVAAREAALTLAGAFANDGFKVRDGFWSGSLTAGAKQTIEVNLYAGNQYWFSMATTAGSKEVKVTVFDETGAQVNTETYAEGSTAAAGLQPTSSGPYFVQVEEVAGGPATFCLVYSYK